MGRSVAKDELYCIYVLRVEGNGWYVGSTQSFERRMRSHFGKGGAVATKERRALAIEEVFELRDYQIRTDCAHERAYWMNHCEHCGMKQGDFEMYCEPQGAFFPMDERAASLIVLHEFAEPFDCNGSTAYGDHLFEYMRRA